MSGELPEQEAKGIPLTRQTDEAKESGLVIYPITARESGTPLLFITKSDVEEAMRLLPSSKSESDDVGTEYSVSFSPATVRISKREAHRIGKKSDNWQPKKAVVQWSDKSRVKMLERFATLDYSPFGLDESLLAFITLTYPSDWKVVVPTAAAAKRHLHTLRKRFERNFGRKFFALWKMEFQRRGAPHFHILAPVPNGPEFREWLSAAWVEVVNHPDPIERKKHLLAGTGVDKAKGVTADTAQRISFYFSKHSSAGKGPKEYQNTPPEEWVTTGSVGRFWGYWGLDVASSTVQMSDTHALFIARTFRRWQRANRKTVVVYVWRVNTRTGVVRKRKSRRKARLQRNSQGFRLIPDSVKAINQIAHYLNASNTS